MATITEDYVSSELAKLLKEKGFYSEDCFAFYKKNGEMCFLQTFGDIADYDSGTCVIAPTLQMAMKWLREVHNVHIDSSIYIDTDGDSEHEYSYTYWDWRIFNSECGSLIAEPALGCGRYDSYEQACNVAIKYCLENLI